MRPLHFAALDSVMVVERSLSSKEGGEGAWQECVPWHVPAAWGKVAAGEQWD